MAATDGQRFMKLKPRFLAAFDWRKAGVRRQEFAEWARKKREPPLRVDERNWSPLKAGQPVPWEMVEALSEYLIAVLKLKNGKDKYRLVQIAENCEPPEEPATVPETGLNAWRLNFLKLFTLKPGAFNVPPEAYCRGEEDIMTAAIMIMHSFGYRQTKSASKEVCLEYAQNVMKRTPIEYASLLLAAWKANENAVLFTIKRLEDGTALRVGVSVVIPLTKRFYLMFRNGKAEDMEARAADIPANSLFLLLDAVNDNAQIDIRQEKARRSMDQASTILFQFAAASPSLNSWSANPSVITIAVDTEGIERLKSYHFKNTGNLTKVTQVKVMEFAPPLKKDTAATTAIELAHYLAFKSMLLVYQYVMVKQSVSE